MSEESNCTLESTNPTPITLLDSDPHPWSYPQTKFPGKLTIGEISDRKLSPLLICRLRSKTLNLFEIKV